VTINSLIDMDQAVMIRFNITVKLCLLFLIFGVAPLMVVMPITFEKLDEMHDTTLHDMQITAAQVGDLIDRNLFERYGDVQAFGTNSAAKDTNNWYKGGASNPLIASMDAYMTNYGLYKVMMVLDLDGRVAAINSTDNKGNKLPVSSIYAKSFKNEYWFQNAKNKNFLKSDILDGTAVQQPKYESIVSDIYQGEDGFVITFSAPIYDYSGKMIGVWVNFADFGLVEDIIKDAYKAKTDMGLKNIAFAITKEDGTALLKYDPSISANEKRDSTAIGVKSLTDIGVPEAKSIVDYAKGYSATQGGSQNEYAVAWQKTDGALGYNGLDWKIIMYQPADYAFADVVSAKQTLERSIIGVLIAIALIGVLIGRIGSGPILSATKAAKRLSQGDFKVEIKGVKQRDEIGDLARAISSIKDTIANYSGQMDAISKAQAVIEFDLDGNVMTANENFCNTMGYKLDEIIGKHHRIFLGRAYGEKHNEQNFWSRLNKGEYQAGEYQRFGKHDKEVWVQASYNPILDPNGKVFKIVKYATDITQAKLKNADYIGQIEAINKFQSVIEFDVNGIIQNANENFCKGVGYRLDEIKGQHHRMFVAKEYGSSQEYKDFWLRLKSGEYQAGEYKRFGKDGREIWIQASYNPILDPNGEVFKIVKYATDVTEVVKTRLENENGMQEAVAVLREVSSGNLTKRMNKIYYGAFAQIKDALNATIDKLNTTVLKMKGAADSVNSASSEISEGSYDLSKRTDQQAKALEESAVAMEEITTTVRQNTTNSENANSLASNAKDVAEKGGDVVSKTADAMKGIEQSSQKIADIINVIDEIAFQTNLLALNAAVEAARAGDAGKGFAVVASEVRALASRSSAASKDIKNLINDSVRQVKTGAGLAKEAGDQLKEIVSSVTEVAHIISDIALASAQQATGIEEVNSAVSSMDEMTRQNASLVQENTNAARVLVEQAAALEGLVRFFKIEENDNTIFSSDSRHENRNFLNVDSPKLIQKQKSYNPANTVAKSKKAAVVQDYEQGWEEF
jgi:PAS domain S-box-containing protein